MGRSVYILFFMIAFRGITCVSLGVCYYYQKSFSHPPQRHPPLFFCCIHAFWGRWPLEASRDTEASLTQGNLQAGVWPHDVSPAWYLGSSVVWKRWCKPRTICDPMLSSSITMATHAPWPTSRMLLKEARVLGLQVQPWLWLSSWCSSSIPWDLQWFFLQGLQRRASQPLQSQQDHIASALSPQLSLHHSTWLKMHSCLCPDCYNHRTCKPGWKGKVKCPPPPAHQIPMPLKEEFRRLLGELEENGRG